MKTPHDWRNELDALRRNPDLIGGRDHLFTRLVSFCAGYEAGFSAAQHQFMTPQQLVPGGFNHFVAEHFGCKQPGGRGWRTLIVENTTSDQEAFELFFRLREAYERKHSA